MLLSSPGGFILGKPGSGKSFISKQEIMGTYIVTQMEAEARARDILGTQASDEAILAYSKEHPTSEIILFDVKASEYAPLVEALAPAGAEEVKLASSVRETEKAEGVYVNPLDLPVWKQLVAGESPIPTQLELMLAIFSQTRVTSNGEAVITSTERTIIDRCIRQIYKKYEDISTLTPEDVAPEKMPTFADLYLALKDQPEPEAEGLASFLELYTEGTFDAFSHTSTFSFSNRLTSFNVSGLGEEMRTFAMLVLLNMVMNRMYYNFKRGVRTFVFIDEVQALFPSQHVTRYFEKLWSEGRSYGLIPTGMSQNIERVLRNETAKYMIKNSGYLFLLEQADDEYKIIRNLLELSDPQAMHIKPGVGEGRGLVRAAGMTVPIRGEIPRDTRLYKIWTTKPNEVLEEKRREFFDSQRKAG